MGLPLISVIIPVFEVAEYLPQCLDSVLGQPGPEIEVIAVDDASPDGSAAILDDRAAADPRLRVVHLAVNGGQGPARNAGLDLASGEYVWFVDGDDRLADGALAAIGARLAHSRPDVLLIDWVSSYAGGRTAPSPGAGLLARVPAGGCTLADLPRLVDLTMTSWSKLLRREFLAGLDVRFAPGIHEDVLVTCAALLAAKSIEAVDRVCYRYRQDRAGSAMVTTSPGAPGHLRLLRAGVRPAGRSPARPDTGQRRHPDRGLRPGDLALHDGARGPRRRRARAGAAPGAAARTSPGCTPSSPPAARPATASRPAPAA